MSFTMSGCGLSATITIADPSLIPEGNCFPNASAVFAGDFGFYVVTGQAIDQNRDPVEAIVFDVNFGRHTTDLNGVPLPAPVCGWRIRSLGTPGLKCPGFTDFEAFIATPDPCQNINFVGP